MKTLFAIVLVLFLAVPAFADRILKARSLTNNQWFQRVDSGDKDEAAFKAEIATQFGVSESDVLVIIADQPKAKRRSAIAEMAAGGHEGLGVIVAPASPESPEELRRKAKKAAISAAITIDELKAAILMPN